MFKKLFLFLVALLLLSIPKAIGQTPKEKWVDSVYSSLSSDAKIGQLFMVPVYPISDEDYMDKIKEAIKSHRVGGFIFMEGTPHEIIALRNYIQENASVPMLLGINGELGLGSSLDSALTFPNPMALGCLRKDSLITELGSLIGKQMNALGLHLNFAPTPILSNSKKINSLSFGGDKTRVAKKTIAFVKGLQQEGILACAKEFPIEGLTILDFTESLPMVNAYLDTNRIYPFMQLIKHGVQGILPASKDFPLFYEKMNLIKKNKYPPSALSALFAGAWIKQNTPFQGLLFMDIQEMVKDEQSFRPGEPELLAFEKGFDIILFPKSIPISSRKIKRLTRKNDVLENQLIQSIKKILATKYDVGLYQPYAPIFTDNLSFKLASPEALNLKRKLQEGAVILLKNEEKILPITHLDDRNIAILSVGKLIPNAFSELSASYHHTANFYLPPRQQDHEAIFSQLSGFQTLLVNLYAPPSDSLLQELEYLQQSYQLVVCSFGPLEWLEKLGSFKTIIQAYGPVSDMEKIVPLSIFGALEINGKLPIAIPPTFPMGSGESISTLKRLGFGHPEDVGMDSRVLAKIDRIVEEGIKMEATPGCQVLVAKDGKIVFQKAYGYLTYDSLSPVTSQTLYDLASITKVMATLQVIMFMYDRNLLDIYKKASFYLPELSTSNKKNFTLVDILTHQAGLWPFLPFWTQTLDEKTAAFKPEFYDTVYSAQYPLQVAPGLFAKTAVRDSLWQWIIDAKIRDKPLRAPYTYKYSDMGFYIFHHLAEKYLNQPMEDFLTQNFYEPLGAQSMGYLPLQRFPPEQIAPTENDLLFRKTILIGTVHDQGAAMHGGVAGHAGLFSNALDLAKMAQMLLQKGYYGGIQYYNPQTVDFFTRKQFKSNRRGLGWDKPEQSSWESPTSVYASPKTFGHTGFTGTAVWVDPEFNLIYVFLSNRVYPDMTNNKLLRANIRSRIQDTLYQAIFSYRSNHY